MRESEKAAWMFCEKLGWQSAAGDLHFVKLAVLEDDDNVPEPCFLSFLLEVNPVLHGLSSSSDWLSDDRRLSSGRGGSSSYDRSSGLGSGRSSGSTALLVLLLFLLLLSFLSLGFLA